MEFSTNLDSSDPNHLARYYILAHLQDPHLHLPQFYASRWQASPYVAVDVLAVFLQKLLPIDIVGRLILSMSLLGLPLACYVFLRQIDYESRYLAAWALVISYGPMFLGGGVNDVLSTALCFWLLALCLRYLAKPDWKLWLGLLLLATLLYFTHLLGFAIGAMIVFTYCVLTRQTVRRLFAATSIFVPGVVIYLLAFFRGRSYWLKEEGPSYRYNIEIAEKLISLANPFRGYGPKSTIFVLIALISCLILAVWGNSNFRLNHVWLRVTIVMSVVYLLSPGANFHLMDWRILPFLFILSLSVARVGPRARVLGAIGLLVFVVRSFEVDRNFISRQHDLEEWHSSFEAIPPDSRIFPMVRAEAEAFQRDYMSFWAYGVIERGWFSPNLFHSIGIHPLALGSPADDTARLLWGKDRGHIGWFVPEPDWPEIQRRFDYLWVFDLPRFSAPISKFAQLVYSEGPVQVFRILPISPPDSGPTTSHRPNQEDPRTR